MTMPSVMTDAEVNQAVNRWREIAAETHRLREAGNRHVVYAEHPLNIEDRAIQGRLAAEFGRRPWLDQGARQLQHRSPGGAKAA